MENDDKHFITVKEYIDNQIDWVKYVKTKEREDIYRELTVMQKQLKEDSRLLYIIVGIGTVVNIAIGLFLKSR